MYLCLILPLISPALKILNSNKRAGNKDEGGTWVSNLSLLHKDKVLLLTRGSLTESICNAAMKVIKPTNSQLDCHQPISQLAGYAGEGKKFIQIIPLK